MSKLTTKQFVELLRRSRLLDEGQLAACVAEIREERPAQDANQLAEELERRGWITSWHAEKLLARKYKGFFLGKYRLLEHIGSGGMSHVYLARHGVIDRYVAIKVLPPAKLSNAGYLDRFRREARAAAKLDHPNIIRAYDVDQDDNLHYIVMEFVEGRNLQQEVKESGSLDYHTAASYIAQAARGLAHAHKAKLIHRDVKPSNLLVTNDGTVKLLDLGLAIFSEENQTSGSLTNDGVVLGTADYISPEQGLDCRQVDYRTDIYSLGCTLYYLLTGSPPFPGGTFTQRILKHQLEQPEPIQIRRPDCPASLISVCNRMMEKDVAARYQSIAEVDLILTNWLNDAGESDGQNIRELSQIESRTKLGGKTGLNFERQNSLIERRKRRDQVSVKTPLGLWAILVALVFVCAGLMVLVFMQI